MFLLECVPVSERIRVFHQWCFLHRQHMPFRRTLEVPPDDFGVLAAPMALDGLGVFVETTAQSKLRCSPKRGFRIRIRPDVDSSIPAVAPMYDRPQRSGVVLAEHPGSRVMHKFTELSHLRSMHPPAGAAHRGVVNVALCVLSIFTAYRHSQLISVTPAHL